MPRLGLALSGGGFRATLYHLGVVRFLRDAGWLPDVSHICSVSGGSVLAAHLVQNWHRYNGTDEEFDQVAEEIVEFTRFDVRNRIIRRMPLTLPIHLLGRFAPVRNRWQFSRTGLLEKNYQHLYGDTCMYELAPEEGGRPELHILATNLSEGTLCSFSGKGVMLDHDRPGQTASFEFVRAGLTPLSLAVAASSAFPAFFPTVPISNEQIGAQTGDYVERSFTDGGVYDNLGVRMFKRIRESRLGDQPLHRHDFADLPRFVDFLLEASKGNGSTPLLRIVELLPAELLAELEKERESGLDDATLKLLMTALNTLLVTRKLYQDEAWSKIVLRDREDQAMFEFARSPERKLQRSNRIWLNRSLFAASLPDAEIVRSYDGGFDTILVSDAGQRFSVVQGARFNPIIGTALRASDILFERVGQLEMESARDDPGFLFLRIADVVETHEDPTAPHPVTQRRLPDVRTDFDRFSSLEISALVRHGYCVTRKMCRSRPDVFGTDFAAAASDEPWVPVSARWRRPLFGPDEETKDEALKDPRWFNRLLRPFGLRGATLEARTLQKSAGRVLLRGLFDFRDWTTYVLLGILLVIAGAGYFGIDKYRGYQAKNQLLLNLKKTNEEFDRLVTVVFENPVEPWKTEKVEEIDAIPELDYSGFEILYDARILDLRRRVELTPREREEDPSPAMWSRWLRLRRLPDVENNDRIQMLYRTTGNDVSIRCTTHPFTVRRVKEVDQQSGTRMRVFELSVDLSDEIEGDVFEVVMESVFWNAFQARHGDWTGMMMEQETLVASMFVIFPEDKPYTSFQFFKYLTAEKRKTAVEYVPDSFVETDTDPWIIGWVIKNAEKGVTYEARWEW